MDRHHQLPEPRKVPKVEQAKFGFTEYAERINSRYAMIGFFALLAVEGVRETMNSRNGPSLSLCICGSQYEV